MTYVHKRDLYGLLTSTRTDYKRTEQQKTRNSFGVYLLQNGALHFIHGVFDS
ncbi:hypothetical protein Sjap_025388 [Stephania japonica]|uniref:Uncharacterized protein n=1 Tax=Stephania japonica TaxID=461633 RepID=A0AAP0E617_9MAGN